MPEGSHHFVVGTIRCTVLSDGYYAYPASWFFPNADPQALSQALDERRLPQEDVLSPLTCLLIQTGSRVVLVDAGAGESSRTTGAMRARLEMAGVRPRDVDTVILTHAHPDHIGGAVDAAGRPVFPNARYVIGELEWEFWTSARTDLRSLRVPEETRIAIHSSARRCLGAVRRQLEPVDVETEVVPGVRVIPAPGHTPGHLAVLVSSGGESLLNLGDAAVHPLHLGQPRWENGFDLACDTAISTRSRLLQRAAAENMHLMAFHFPFPSVGRIEADASGGWAWTPGW
ncbi:MAG TPA: MBL fold metallo-hydrolase [Candidatus Acidoferrales bacterium]|nr:MBL fold metallo-hydrolase [Candidatus Acidoferrales bacterium]